jgi:hypothetical protein
MHRNSHMRWTPLLSFFFIGSAGAQQFTATSIARSSPQIVMSIGGSDIPGTFINWNKSCGSQHFTAGASPASLDANGYPNISSPSNVIYVACQLPSRSQYHGTWEIGWKGTGARTIQGTGITVISDPQRCSQGNGVLVGTNCDVTFNFNSDPNITLQFPKGGTFSNMNGGFLIRTSDKVAFLSGNVTTPEFDAIAGQLKPLAWRTMGMSSPVFNQSSWNYRTPVTADSWVNPVWFPALWSSSITGTDQYIAAAASGTPAQWTDGEVLQGHFTNGSAAAITIDSSRDNSNNEIQLRMSSTSTLFTGQNVLVANCATATPPRVYTITVKNETTVDLNGTTYSPIWNTCPESNGAGQLTTTTINVGGRGAKFILPFDTVLGSPAIQSGDFGTLIYNSLLGIELYVSAVNGGFNGGVPIEALTTLANETHTPLWWNVPTFFSTSDVTSAVHYLSSDLESKLYLEYGNEDWNFFNQLFLQSGLALALNTNIIDAEYSDIGLRTRQVFGAATRAWTRDSSQLIRVNAAQAFGPPSQFDADQFKGTYLCGASCGNSTYQSIIGLDYNSSPNRPEDFSDAYSIASYFSGAQENGNDSSLKSYTQLDGIIAASIEFAAGDPSDVEDALNFVDADTRNGACGGCTGADYTISSFEANIAASWNKIAVNDGKSIIAYEGGLSSYGPTAPFLRSIGDSNAAADAAKINNLLIAYRASPQFYATYLYQNQKWFSNSQVIGNANLQLQLLGYSGGGINIGSQYWGLLAGWYFPPVPYQSYLAIGLINGGLSLFKRP